MDETRLAAKSQAIFPYLDDLSTRHLVATTGRWTALNGSHNLAQKARQRARDDLAAMFYKRVTIKVAIARPELDEIRQRQQATSTG